MADTLIPPDTRKERLKQLILETFAKIDPETAANTDALKEVDDKVVTIAAAAVSIFDILMDKP